VITIHQRHRQTDRRTYRQTTCDRNTALCSKVHRAVKMDVSLTVFQILTHLARKWLVFTTPPLFEPPSGRTPCEINVIYTLLECGLQFRRWHCGSIFIRLAVVAPKIAKSREIPTKFDLTAVQGHQRSSILVSIESSHGKSVCYFEFAKFKTFDVRPSL